MEVDLEGFALIAKDVRINGTLMEIESSENAKAFKAWIGYVRSAYVDANCQIGEIIAASDMRQRLIILLNGGTGDEYTKVDFQGADIVGDPTIGWRTLMLGAGPLFSRK